MNRLNSIFSGLSYQNFVPRISNPLTSVFKNHVSTESCYSFCRNFIASRPTSILFSLLIGSAFGLTMKVAISRLHSKTPSTVTPPIEPAKTKPTEPRKTSEEKFEELIRQEKYATAIGIIDALIKNYSKDFSKTSKVNAFETRREFCVKNLTKLINADKVEAKKIKENSNLSCKINVKAEIDIEELFYYDRIDEALFDYGQYNKTFYQNIDTATDGFLKQRSYHEIRNSANEYYVGTNDKKRSIKLGNDIGFQVQNNLKIKIS